ncbi:nuclear transport factor 2 family protein [Puia dinghuensis]|uniref:SnoaL-like domain-containing protein n=1 Tax=Puia dinghuensis TaxID=1792502 RepID=A0A8J2U681_9BACT|nr:hypothetical protein GCM10011511_00770 [Puia dinghuensis]
MRVSGGKWWVSILLGIWRKTTFLKTWELFFSCLEKSDKSFQIVDLQITAGEEVAFCYASMRCIYSDNGHDRIELDFRLTIGFKKIEGEWWFMHEHHSVPAE